MRQFFHEILGCQDAGAQLCGAMLGMELISLGDVVLDGGDIAWNGLLGAAAGLQTLRFAFEKTLVFLYFL